MLHRRAPTARTGVPMIDFSRNHFALFGLPEHYRFDADALDRAYRALQSDVHPDRHAAADDQQRRLSLQASARVNEAYRTLKDRVGRAEYLLQLRGVDPTAGTDTALPFEFLERQLERREAADHAVGAGDGPALDALQRSVRSESAAIEARLHELLDRDGDFTAARMPVRELRFLAKLDADIDAMAADLDD
jgi:molecular chaperone HscB